MPAPAGRASHRARRSRPSRRAPGRGRAGRCPSPARSRCRRASPAAARMASSGCGRPVTRARATGAACGFGRTASSARRHVPGPVHIATGVPTSTVAPASTSSDTILPGAGASTSLLILSVSTTNRIWPASTSSPGATSHSASRPFGHRQPELGHHDRDFVSGCALSHRSPAPRRRSAPHPAVGGLERPSERHRHEGAADPHDRSVELVEADLRHPRRDLRADAERLHRLVRDDQPVRPRRAIRAPPLRPRAGSCAGRSPRRRSTAPASVSAAASALWTIAP